jgi:hypothetical protein
VHLFCVSAVRVNLFMSFFILPFLSSLCILSSLHLFTHYGCPWSVIIKAVETRFETRLSYSLSDVTSEPVNGFSLTKWRKCYSRRYTLISKKSGTTYYFTLCMDKLYDSRPSNGSFCDSQAEGFGCAATFKEYKRKANLVTSPSC